MERRLPNELNPIDIGTPNFWQTALEELIAHPNKVLPVFLRESRLGKEIGGYFMNLQGDDDKIYLQAEGFSSKEMESGFVIGSCDEWKTIQPGIYRLDITEYIKAFETDDY